MEYNQEGSVRYYFCLILKFLKKDFFNISSYLTGINNKNKFTTKILIFCNLKKFTPFLFLLLASAILFGHAAIAQTAIAIDTIPKNDSLRTGIVVIATDTLLKAKDSLTVNKKGDITTTIKYTAKDSMRMDVRKKLVYMYTDAKIDYGDISLGAQTVDINWGNNEMRASGGKDTTTGKKIGVPVFKQGSETYTSNKIRYNFKTKKGLISGLVTQQGEGYIHGETVKRKDEMLYISHARYTTCNLEHPHFYINATKLKVIPEKKIVAGPFNIVVADIKTPIGFFLGFFPVPKKNKSGLIFPTYGENANGFFVTRGGYYFALSDYVGLQLTGDYYSKGTHGLQMNADYRKRYRYNGATNFEYFNFKTEDERGKITSQKLFRFSWNHSTDTKGTSSLSANVGIASAQYLKVASFNAANRLSNDFRSSVNYRKTFKGTPFSLSISLNQSQNVNTKLMTLSGLPDLNFAMNRIFPFKPKGGTGKSWYEQISIAYNLSAKLTFDNGFYRYIKGTPTRIDSGLVLSNVEQLGYIFNGGTYYKVKDSLYKEQEFNKGEKILLNGSQYGARHTVPIGTTIKILKYFNLNPGITLSEYWFPSYQKFNPSDTLGKYTSETQRGFSRAWGWSTGGTSLKTNIYGTYQFKKSKLMGIRHQLTPSITYTYTPDLTNPSYGGHEQIYRTNGSPLLDAFGNPVRVGRFDKFNQLGVPSGSRESSIIGFDLNNVFEAKVRTTDTANPTKKFYLFDNISLSSRYDLLADSFQLSNFIFNARTNIKDGRLLLSFNTTLDPYAYVGLPTGRDKYNNVKFIRTKEYSINKNQGWAHMTNGNITASTSLNPNSFKREKPKSALDKNTSDQAKYIKANQDQYVDFNVPWNVSLSYQINFVGNYFLYEINRSNPGLANITTNSVNINGDISVTEKWKVTYGTSYDLKSKLIPYASIGIIRDLHCWSMSMNINKFGDNYNFLFNINAKSTLLQDLKLTKRSPGLLNTAGF